VTEATRPPWLTLPAPDPEPLRQMRRLLEEHALHTVCESADCPNVSECFSRRTCTFMILGDVCTRRCRFCAVTSGRPASPDPDEPARVASAARVLGLAHVVVTSVTRDDLADGGAAQFVATIRQLRQLPHVTVEVLVPDFGGDVVSFKKLLDAEPDVLGHNIETVPRLYSEVRPGASYERSLGLLARVARRGGVVAKSGLMLGLGETLQEAVEVLADLRPAGCEVVTLGQYLSPSADSRPVAGYVSPQTFAALERRALAMGVRACVAGPLVRSSYRADATLRARPAV
jgi:lipoic acid synthetase